MQKVIQVTMRTLGCKRIMFGFDEMHGFNKDSRSRALGRSNAETLAYTINKLQTFMEKEDPASRAMIWADMLCPFHNGGRPHYQQYSGEFTVRHGMQQQCCTRTSLLFPGGTVGMTQSSGL